MHPLRSRLAELTALTGALAAAVSLLDGPAYGAGLAIVVAAGGFGTFMLLAEREPRGVPLESLALPLVATFAFVGLPHLAGVGPWWPIALLAGAAALVAAVATEARLLGPVDERRSRAERQLLPLTVALAFAAFAAAAGSIPGGIAEPLTGAAPGPDGTLSAAGLSVARSSLLLLGLLDAGIAFLLGYRLAALRTTSASEAAWAAGTFAVVIGISAALFRAVDLPRLFGPAVLAGVFYLWSTYRGASAAQRRSFAWLWEYVVLAAALALAVVWNLLLR